MNTILIDLDHLVPIASVDYDDPDNIRKLETVADKKIPESPYYIGGEEITDFRSWPMLDLQLIYRNVTEKELKITDSDSALKEVHKILQELPVGNHKKFKINGAKLRPTTEKGQTYLTRSPRKEKLIGAVVKRPATGTKTGIVWDTADDLMKEDSSLDPTQKEFKEEVIRLSIKQGVNKSTAGVQYSKWKKNLINPCK